MGGFFLYMAQLQFSDTTNKLGLIQACETICGLGDTGISGNTQLLKEFTRHINKVQSEMWTWIFFSYGGWQFEDANQSGQPNASQTLTSGTSEYTPPTGTHGIRGVEVQDTGGVWHTLAPLTPEEIRQRQAISEFFKTASNPMYYTLVGNKITIYPAPNYTQASSLKVFYDREMVAFASTDTTKIPGIPSVFHDDIPVGASIEWLSLNKPASRVLEQKMAEWAKAERKIKKFFTQRYEERYPGRFGTTDFSLQNI